jgi:hypothetical protein
MPNINFPTSPALNDQYSFEGKTWTYNGVAWVLTSSPTSLRLDSAYGHANAAFSAANNAFNASQPLSGEFDYGLITDVNNTIQDYGTL